MSDEVQRPVKTYDVILDGGQVVSVSCDEIQASHTSGRITDITFMLNSDVVAKFKQSRVVGYAIADEQTPLKLGV